MAEKNDVTKIELTSGGKPPKVVEMPDGSTVEYPADMSNEEIGRNIVKSFKMPASGPAGSAGRPDSASNTLVVPSAPPAPPPNRDMLSESPNMLPEAKNRFGQNVGEPTDRSKDEAIDAMRPWLGDVIGRSVGGAAGVAALPVTGGLGSAPAYGAGYLAGYDATDMALQYAKDKKPKDLQEAFYEANKSAAITKFMDWAVPGVMRGVGNAYKEYTAPGSVVNKTMVGLQATFSQLYDDMFKGRTFTPKWLEDVFASGAKNTAMNRSAQIGTKMANDIGGTVQSNFDPAEYFVGSQKNLVDIIKESKAYSTAQGDTAIAISEMFPQTRTITIAGPQPLGQPGNPLLHPVTQQPLMSPPKTMNVTVSGPIDLHNGRAVAQQIITDMDDIINSTSIPAQAKVLSPDQAELRKIAQNIVDRTTDKEGKSIFASLRDAWTLKKIADDFHTYARVSAAKGQVTSTDSFYKDISRAINTDIDMGFDSWPVSRTDPVLAQKQIAAKAQAFRAWTNAKEAVGQRLALLDAEGSKLKDVIEAGTTNLPALDRLLGDHQELNRALQSGEVSFPGTGGKGRVYTANRRDLQNYKIQRMFDDAWKVNRERPTEKAFSATSLMTDWNDSAFKSSKKILWNQSQINEYDKLFNAIASTQGKQAVSNARIRVWHGGLSFASSLVAGFLKGGGTVAGSAVWGGGTLTAIGASTAIVAKLMTKPDIARVLAAGISGAPLGMSTEAFARHFAKAAAGETLTIIGAGGKEQKATVDEDGNLLPTQ